MTKVVAAAGLALAIGAGAANAETVQIDCDLKQIIRKVGDAEARGLTLALSLDTDTGRAAIVNESGPDEVKVVRGNQATTFVQLFPSGEIRTTTISNQGRAAHTRHGIERGEVVPTLYHGNCR